MITFRVKRMSAQRIRSVLEHDLRTGYLPENIDRDRMKDNEFLIKNQTTSREFLDEFDLRIAKINDSVSEHKKKIDSLPPPAGVDARGQAKRRSGYRRSVKKQKILSRGREGVIGLEHKFLKGKTYEEKCDALRKAFVSMKKELKLTDEDFSHAVIHKDETNPHLHFACHYYDSKGKSLEKRITKGTFSKVLARIHKDQDLTPNEKYMDRRERGEKVSSKNKTSYQMRVEAERDLAKLETKAKRLNVSIAPLQKKKAELESQVKELTEKVPKLESQKSELESQVKELAEKAPAVDKKKIGKSGFVEIWAKYAVEKLFNDKGKATTLVTETTKRIPKEWASHKKTWVQKHAQIVKDKLLEKFQE